LHDAHQTQGVRLAHRVGKSKLSFGPSITEDSPGTPGEVHTDSRFGTTVTAVPGRRSSEAILAISSPFQNGGSVYLFPVTPRSNPGPAARKRRHPGHRNPLRPIRRLTADLVSVVVLGR
jgi:hypothetical protein